MPAFARDEALAFVEAIRLNLVGKTGYRWFVERLVSLSEYIESIAAENARLHAYLEESGSRDDYDDYCESGQ